MKVFDCHVHVFPDKIAAQTVAMLGAKAGIEPVYDGSRNGLLATMADAGIAGALNCPIATRPEQVESINRWAIQQNRWPVLSLGTMHPDYPEPAEELARLRDAGLAGIKLHPEYQESSLDDPRLAPVWAACETLGLVPLVHCGADIGFPPPYRSNPDGVLTLTRRYPKLTLIAAHFGSWQMWDDVESCLLGTRVYLDLAFVLGLMPGEVLVARIRKHGIDRVLFGTDAPWRDPKRDLRLFDALPLTGAERSRILWQNAADLFAFGPGGNATGEH